MEAETEILPENFPNFQASGLDIQVEQGSELEREIKGPNGTIFTGFYKNTQHLPDNENKAKFHESRCLRFSIKSLYKHRNASTTNSEGMYKTLDQIYR